MPAPLWATSMGPSSKARVRQGSVGRPDGVSFDSPDILDALYADAGLSWIENEAIEHYAWIFDDPSDTSPWYELGFARMHARGVLAFTARKKKRGHSGIRFVSADRQTSKSRSSSTIFSTKPNSADRASRSSSNMALGRRDARHARRSRSSPLRRGVRRGRDGQCITFPSTRVGDLLMTPCISARWRYVRTRAPRRRSSSGASRSQRRGAGRISLRRDELARGQSPRRPVLAPLWISDHLRATSSHDRRRLDEVGLDGGQKLGVLRVTWEQSAPPNRPGDEELLKFQRTSRCNRLRQTLFLALRRSGFDRDR